MLLFFIPMRKYELFLILNAQKDETAAQKTLRDVENILAKFEAKVTANNGGQNQRLAYPINKRIDSYQVVLEVEAKPDAIDKINKQFAITDEVVRANFFTLATK